MPRESQFFLHSEQVQVVAIETKEQLQSNSIEHVSKEKPIFI